MVLAVMLLSGLAVCLALAYVLDRTADVCFRAPPMLDVRGAKPTPE